MAFKTSLQLFTAFLAIAQAVDITLYTNEGCPDTDVTLRCTNFPQGTNQCCTEDGLFAQSVRFDSLPTEGIPAQGVAYEGPNGTPSNGCATSCNSGTGLNLCLGCSSGIDGANWVQPQQGTRALPRRPADQPCNITRPDQIGFKDGRWFRINHNVPVNVTAELFKLGNDDPYLTNLPAHLMEYEVVN